MPERRGVGGGGGGRGGVLPGQGVVHAETGGGGLTAPADPDAVAHELLGAVVERVGRRGKYLIVQLADGRALVSHLRMTGWYHHVPEPDERPHLRALFGLDDGTWVLYADQRRFGTMRLLGPGELEEHWLRRVGPARPLPPPPGGGARAAAARGGAARQGGAARTPGPG